MARVHELSAGKLEVHAFESRLLAKNHAGDPNVREFPIYVPHAASRAAPLPLVFLLIGFTGNGQEFLETHPWRQGLLLEYDAALLAGNVPPAILAFPNCFTKYGGSQYVDSSTSDPMRATWSKNFAPSPKRTRRCCTLVAA